MGSVYEPSPEEIRRRCEFERLMKENEWPDDLLASIMIYDMPSIDTVLDMIRRQGHSIARMKIRHFLGMNQSFSSLQGELDVL